MELIVKGVGPHVICKDPFVILSVAVKSYKIKTDRIVYGKPNPKCGTHIWFNEQNELVMEEDEVEVEIIYELKKDVLK